MSAARRRRQRDRKIEEFYDRLPKIACQGKCGSSCGPISMQRAEAERIEAFTGAPLKPYHGPFLAGCCPYLSNSGRCLTYETRPLICRLWGVLEVLPCPHGCELERAIDQTEAMALYNELMEICGEGIDDFVHIAPIGDVFYEEDRQRYRELLQANGGVMPVHHEGY